MNFQVRFEEGWLCELDANGVIRIGNTNVTFGVMSRTGYSKEVDNLRREWKLRDLYFHRAGNYCYIAIPNSSPALWDVVKKCQTFNEVRKILRGFLLLGTD